MMTISIAVSDSLLPASATMVASIIFWNSATSFTSKHVRGLLRDGAERHKTGHPYSACGCTLLACSRWHSQPKIALRQHHLMVKKKAKTSLTLTGKTLSKTHCDIDILSGCGHFQENLKGPNVDYEWGHACRGAAGQH